MRVQKISRYLLLGALAALLMGGIAYSQTQALQAVQSMIPEAMLTAAASYAQCQVNFTDTMAAQINTDVPSLSTQLNAQVTQINTVNAQLQSDAAAGNVTTFRSYLVTTFQPTFRSASRNITTALRAANLSSNTITLIWSQYNTTRVTLQSCQFAAAQQYALAKLAAYKAVIAYYNELAANASSRGVNVAPVTQVIQGANSSVIQPFQSGISNAHNASQIVAVVNGYCLYNDCANGYNYHLEVKGILAVFNIGFNNLQSYPNVTSQQNITLIHGWVDNAQNELNAVGNGQYSGNQEQIIYNNLTSAVNLTKQVAAHAHVHIGGKGGSGGYP